MIKNFKLKAGILSIFLTPILIGSGLSPILPDVAKFVGEDGAFLSKLFLTLPSLAVIPFLFLSSILTFYFKKRNLVIVGLLLYIFSGIGCMVSFNIYWLMFFRVMLGIGAGFVVPYSNSLFADYFIPNKRFKMISYAGVLTFFGGIIILILAGVLSQIHWRLAFLVHFIALIPLWFLWRYVPHPTLNSVHIYPVFFSFVLKPKVWFICFFYLLKLLLRIQIIHIRILMIVGQCFFI
jgi:MFS family permease